MACVSYIRKSGFRLCLILGWLFVSVSAFSSVPARDLSGSIGGAGGVGGLLGIAATTTGGGVPEWSKIKC